MIGIELSYCSNLAPVLSKLSKCPNFVILPYLPKRLKNIPICHDLATMFKVFHITDTNFTFKNLAIKLKINSDYSMLNDKVRHQYLESLKDILTNLNNYNVTAIILEIGEENNIISEVIATFCLKIRTRLCLQFPVVFKKFNESIDSWIWWNKIRTQCNFHHKLCVILEINTTDVDLNCLKRWASEPLFGLTVGPNAFILNKHEQPVFKKSYQEAVKLFLILRPKLILKNILVQSKCSDYCLDEYQKIRNYLYFFSKKCFNEETYAHSQSINYCDKLQTALQPQAEFLDCFTYDVFEKDDTKYNLYEMAIEKAYTDNFLDCASPIVIVVAGAGRGPIVQACLNVLNKLKSPAKLYAIERNPVALTILNSLKQVVWKDRVEIFSGDMRTLDIQFKINILVSELLGSFGDNELSPECLYPLQKYYADKFVCIPQSYTSCLAPLQYPKLLTSQEAEKNDAFFDYPYVTYLVNYYEIDKAKDLFTFNHPVKEEDIRYDRFGVLKFKASQTCLLNGFVGYFRSVLYRDVIMSIEPATYSTNMFSWFPIIFPLSQPVLIKADDTIEVAFWRQHSNEFVWYEWALREPSISRIHNVGGTVYQMKKMSN